MKRELLLLLTGCCALAAPGPESREPAPLRSEVRRNKGLPALFVNGSLTSSLTFFARNAKDAQPFLNAGFTIVDFGVPFGWVGPEQYDFTGTDAVMEEFLKTNPKLLALPRFNITPGDWWCRAFPREVAARPDGTPAVSHHQGPQPQCHPSFASDKYRQLARGALRAFLTHLESKYGDRIVGYFPGNGVYGEWLSWNSYWEIEPGAPPPGKFGFEDYSQPAQAAFRRWLKQKYAARVDDLRRAWGDPAVTFAAAAVPSEETRKRPTHGIFFDPAVSRQAPDYFEFFNDLVSDVLLEQCRSTKEFVARRKIAGVFYGYLWTNKQYLSMNHSGHLGFHKVLKSPDVDFIAGPHDYNNRGVGGGNTAQTLTDSIALHGKLYFNEVDTETHLQRRQWRWGDSLRNPRNFQETRGLLLRDFAYAFTKGFGMWYMDLLGGTYNDPEITEFLSQVRALDQKYLDAAKLSAPDIAVIVDADSLRSVPTGEPFLSALLPAQKQFELNYIGAPYDAYLLPDLEDPAMRDYKLYIFLNAFAVSPAERNAIHARLKRNHATALWVYAPGYISETLSVANMQALTGIRVADEASPGELRVEITSHDHPYTKALPPRFAYGTDVNVAGIRRYFDHRVYLKDPSDPALRRNLPGFRISPRFYGADAAATVLGRLAGLDRPGLLVKAQSGWTSVYSSAPILPAALLRNIARAAGCHVYSDAGDVIYANRDFLAVYAPAGGERKIHLPRSARVIDLLENRTLSSGTADFSLSMDANTTRLLMLQ